MRTGYHNHVDLVNGYEIEIKQEGEDPFLPEYGVCVTQEGEMVGTVSELSGLIDLMTGGN